MALNRVQTLRNSTPGVRPSGQLPGTLYTNWPDNQLGVVNAANAAVDLLAVRYFSSLTSYVIGDHVVQGGVLYRANAPSVPGAFVPANWSALAPLASGGVTQKQFRKALVDLGNGLIAGLPTTVGAIYTVAGAINPDFTDLANIQWYGGGSVLSGDALTNAVQTALGFTSGQMSTLLAYAAGLPQ